MPRAGPRPASRCCSRWGAGSGNARCSRGRSPIRTGRSGSTSPPRRTLGGPIISWRSGPMPRRQGLAGQAFSPSALPATGPVQLKLGGPVHTAVRVVGPDGKPVAGARVAPAWLRVAGGGSARLDVPAARLARRPARGHDRRRRQGGNPGLSSRGHRGGPGRSRRVRSPGKRARRGGRRRPDDHAEGRRPADRPRSGRRSRPRRGGWRSSP